MNEEIVGIVDGLGRYWLASLLSRHIAVFTNQQLIILSTSKEPRVGVSVFQVIGEISSISNNDYALQEFEKMNAEQIINSDYEKIIISKKELGNVELLERPFIMMSSIVVNSEGKTYKFKMMKKVFRRFKELLEGLKNSV
jgi:hypothetical protein